MKIAATVDKTTFSRVSISVTVSRWHQAQGTLHFVQYIGVFTLKVCAKHKLSSHLRHLTRSTLDSMALLLLWQMQTFVLSFGTMLLENETVYHRNGNKIENTQLGHLTGPHLLYIHYSPSLPLTLGFCSFPIHPLDTPENCITVICLVHRQTHCNISCVHPLHKEKLPISEPLYGSPLVSATEVICLHSGEAPRVGEY